MLQLLEDGGDQRPEMGHPIRRRPDEEDPKRQGGNTLLKLEIAIHRKERSELASSQPQQLAVRDACPALLTHRPGIMAGKEWSQVKRELLVKQNAHDP